MKVEHNGAYNNLVVKQPSDNIKSLNKIIQHAKELKQGYDPVGRS